MEDTKHVPVLLEAVLKYLGPQAGDSYLDLTAGYGGHAKAILELTSQPTRAVLVDRDQVAIDYLSEQFHGSGATIIHQDFLGASQELARAGRQFDLILADLGVSSPHLDKASRGFSFRLDGPLDMRMDERQSQTAADIVNNYSVADLAALLKRYGEEPRANQIAQAIVANRPVTSTHDLATIVAAGVRRRQKIHPATRVFQALRLAVNQELEQLEAALPRWLELLAPGGRIVVISFHSLEDRLVKRIFAEHAGNRYDAVLRLLTKQPVKADAAETVFNPRARSAKLRAAVKIKTN